MAVETQILSNNVVLVTESVATVKTAAVGFWFPVGSRYEGEGQRGVCHFVEHMVFKGTTTRSAFDIALAFDRMGGYLNAFTDRETMCLHCVVPAIHLRQALEVMVDMASNSVFDQKELERERAVIQSEIVSSQDDPEEAALDAASEAVWPIFIHQKFQRIVGDIYFYQIAILNQSDVPTGNGFRRNVSYRSSPRCTGKSSIGDKSHPSPTFISRRK